MGPAEVLVALIVIGLPIILMIIGARGYYRLQEKKLDAETSLAAEKAANMPPAMRCWRRGSGCSSRSSPTAVSRPPTRSKRCGTGLVSRPERKFDEPV